MKKVTLLVIAIFCLECASINAQSTVFITPVEDAVINDLNPTTNFGNHQHFTAADLTSPDVSYTVRSLMKFDFSAIPSGATIDDAILHLYADQHIDNDKSADCYIIPLTSTWYDTAVTWDMQPTFSVGSPYDAYLSHPGSDDQDYSVNVKDLIELYIDDPSQNYGIVLMLNTDANGNSPKPSAELQFGSIDNSDTTLIPELEVEYTEAYSVSSTITNANESTQTLGSISLSPSGGNAPYTYLWSNGQTTASISGLSVGTYSVVITDDNGDEAFRTLQVNSQTAWTNMVGVAESNGELSKTVSSAWGNAGASSAAVLAPDRDGYFTYTKGTIDFNTMFGLSNKDSNAHYNTIKYAFHITNGHTLNIYENGTLIGGYGALSTNDVLKIERKNNQIIYSKNSSVLRTVATTSAEPLLLDVAMYWQGNNKLEKFTTNFLVGSSNYYANLKHELDASYFKAYNGVLRFKYRERYLSGNLKFRIYDDLHVLKLDDATYTASKNTGTNWYTWNMKAISSNFITNKYYVLEVIDENDRSQFLRFKMLGAENEFVTNANAARITNFDVQPAK